MLAGGRRQPVGPGQAAARHRSRAVAPSSSASGRRGALLAGRPAGDARSPPPRVEVVDTVGAGDTLNGALAAGLAAGLDLEAAARRAVIAASLAITRPGAREGMPTAAELEDVLAKGARG